MIHEKLKNAIADAVKGEEQPESVATMIERWLEEVINGNETLEDLAKVTRRCESLYNAVELED